MTFRFRFPLLFEGLFAAAQIRHASHWGDCARCGHTTPWSTTSLHGGYRCTECGRSPLGTEK